MSAPTTIMTPETLVAKLDALDDETVCFDGLATYALIRQAASMIRSLRQQKEDANLAATGLRIKAVQDRAKIEALTAENQQLRVMADEPATKRVWDGIQAMAALFSDPAHMPTVLEFKAAFDAAFVIDGKPYDVERIKAEWQADYAAMEARATAAEAERDRWIADWRGEKAEAERLDEHAGALECSLERVRSELAASLERERAMREALKKCAAAFEQPLTGVEEAALKAARAALQSKDATHG